MICEIILPVKYFYLTDVSRFVEKIKCRSFIKVFDTKMLNFLQILFDFYLLYANIFKHFEEMLRMFQCKWSLYKNIKRTN